MEAERRKTLEELWAAAVKSAVARDIDGKTYRFSSWKLLTEYRGLLGSACKSASLTLTSNSGSASEEPLIHTFAPSVCAMSTPFFSDVLSGFAGATSVFFVSSTGVVTSSAQLNFCGVDVASVDFGLSESEGKVRRSANDLDSVLLASGALLMLAET